MTVALHCTRGRGSFLINESLLLVELARKQFLWNVSHLHNAVISWSCLVRSCPESGDGSISPSLYKYCINTAFFPSMKNLIVHVFHR